MGLDSFLNKISPPRAIQPKHLQQICGMIRDKDFVDTMASQSGFEGIFKDLCDFAIKSLVKLSSHGIYAKDIENAGCDVSPVI